MRIGAGDDDTALGHGRQLVVHQQRRHHRRRVLRSQRRLILSLANTVFSGQQRDEPHCGRRRCRLREGPFFVTRRRVASRSPARPFTAPPRWPAQASRVCSTSCSPGSTRQVLVTAANSIFLGEHRRRSERASPRRSRSDAAPTVDYCAVEGFATTRRHRQHRCRCDLRRARRSRARAGLRCDRRRKRHVASCGLGSDLDEDRGQADELLPLDLLRADQVDESRRRRYRRRRACARSGCVRTQPLGQRQLSGDRDVVIHRREHAVAEVDRALGKAHEEVDAGVIDRDALTRLVRRIAEAHGEPVGSVRAHTDQVRVGETGTGEPHHHRSRRARPSRLLNSPARYTTPSWTSTPGVSDALNVTDQRWVPSTSKLANTMSRLSPTAVASALAVVSALEASQ